MADIVPSVLSKDARFSALAALSERLQQLDLSVLLHHLVDIAPAPALPFLADQFHIMGHEGWSVALDDATQRQLIKSAIELHRHKGTAWAMRKALAAVGLDVEIIDQMSQRAIYAQHNPLLVDGAWLLDGSKQLKTLADVTHIPQLQHWANFLVRCNLAVVSSAESIQQLRNLVEEWKPARAWPLFVFWLALSANVQQDAASTATVQKACDAHVLPGVRLCASTQLGTGWTVKSRRIDSSAAVQINGEASSYTLPKLNAFRQLDGSWSLGQAKLLVDFSITYI